jgi:hypothetical protein
MDTDSGMRRGAGGMAASGWGMSFQGGILSNAGRKNYRMRAAGGCRPCTDPGKRPKDANSGSDRLRVLRDFTGLVRRRFSTRTARESRDGALRGLADFYRGMNSSKVWSDFM